MNYFANPAMFQKNFNVPSVVAEKHLKLATPTQLRVLLYVLSHLSEDPADGEIASALSLPESDVADALSYWGAAQIFIPKTGGVAVAESREPKKVVKSAVVKPSREEIIRRGTENEQIAELLQEAQNKFGRSLKFNETSSLVWLFDDLGMDISLILMLLEYAKAEAKLNVSFIERTAIEWTNNGVDSIITAEKYITAMYEKKTAWRIVEAAFGIEPRMASKKELEYAGLWVKDWGFSREMLRAAYEKCVDVKSKFDIRYTARILENWHLNGYTTIKDIEEAESARKSQKKKHTTFASSDISEIDAMLNIGYKE